MHTDDAFVKMLDLEYVEAAPILKTTLIERAPGYGVDGETLRALHELPEGRYSRDELERWVPSGIAHPSAR